ncbi:hypothetical protein L1887_54992 [Cichorium endivia]|nr:hypothetical protein L1887_54992 [Cichorium endivia]
MAGRRHVEHRAPEKARKRREAPLAWGVGQAERPRPLSAAWIWDLGASRSTWPSAGADAMVGAAQTTPVRVAVAADPKQPWLPSFRGTGKLR